MILRDHLALDRTRLANDRTLLSFLRTSLYLLATAVAFWELDSLQKIRFLSWVLTVASLIAFVVGIWNYVKVKKKLNGYYQTDENNQGQMPIDGLACYSHFPM